MGRTGHCTAEIRGCSWKAAVRPNPEVALESKVRDTIHVPVQHSLLVYFFCGIIYHSMQKTLFALGLGLGGLITYVDTRPNWDDTGVSALVIFLSCGLLGVTSPARPWLWALAVGLGRRIVDTDSRDHFKTQLRFAPGGSDCFCRGICWSGVSEVACPSLNRDLTKQLDLRHCESRQSSTGGTLDE